MFKVQGPGERILKVAPQRIRVKENKVEKTNYYILIYLVIHLKHCLSSTISHVTWSRMT